jgi:hypothetical protein
MYGWPKSDSENSPEELERYRIHCNRALGEAMGRNEDWTFNGMSHIWEAVWIAALNRVNRLEICRKLVREATNDDKDGSLGTLYNIGTDGDDYDWPGLDEQLKRLIS